MKPAASSDRHFQHISSITCAREEALFFLAIFLYLIIMREESLKYARKKKEIRQQKKEVFETPLTSQRERERERERERRSFRGGPRRRSFFFRGDDAVFTTPPESARGEKLGKL